MLVCVYYDRFNGNTVTKINQLRINSKFCSGLSFIDQTLDQLASTSGFVCFRCKEEFTVETEKGREACWIFEIKKGAVEYMEVMGLLYEAKLHSTSTAATIRGLIDQSRVMCDACRKLERPLVATHDVSTISNHHAVDIVETKPMIQKFTRKIEVQSDFANTAEISEENNRDVSAHAPSVGANQDVSMEPQEEQDIKPSVKLLNLQMGIKFMAPAPPTLSNDDEPISEMLQRLENERTTQPIAPESSQEENDQPGTTSPVSSMEQNTTTVLPPRVDMGMRDVKREICENRLNTSYNHVSADNFAGSATTLVPQRDVTPVQGQSVQPPAVEQQLSTPTSGPVNHKKRKGDDAWLANLLEEQNNNPFKRVKKRLSGLIDTVARPPVHQEQEKRLDFLQIDARISGEQPGTSAETDQSQNVSSTSSADELSTSYARDCKHGISRFPQVDSPQKGSHFDAIVNSDTTNTLLSNMAVPLHLNMTTSPSIRTSIVAGRRSTDMTIPVGHCHLASQEYIGIGTTEGFLPIYKVNHNCTQFQRLRVTDLNPTTRLRFHSSLLKRKTEEWIPVQVTEIRTLPTGEVNLHYNHEVFRKPGQMRKAPKPVKLCCDALLHFILIHTDDLAYRQ